MKQKSGDIQSIKENGIVSYWKEPILSDCSQMDGMALTAKQSKPSASVNSRLP